MDEEDEKRLLIVEERQMRGVCYSPIGFTAREGEITFRLYDEEELAHKCGTRGRKSGHHDTSPEALRNAQYAAQGVPYRFLRFCGTMLGFHKGSLDLTGRHPARYNFISARWELFLTEFVRINPNDQATIQAFQDRWRLRLNDVFVCLPMIGEVLLCIKANPEPVLQRLNLVDLPREMLHEIAQFSQFYQPSDARNLASTCKLLRGACWRVVNEIRVLGPHPRWHLTRIPRHLPEAVRMEGAQKIALNQRARFLRRADLLCARPDIAQCVRRLAFRSWGTPAARAEIWGTSEENAERDGCIVRAMRDVVLKTTNVTRLSLHEITITGEFAEAIFSLPRLSFLSLHSSGIDFRDREPRNQPARLEHVVLDYGSPNDPDPQWQILLYIPNVRWLCVQTELQIFNLPSWSLLQELNPIVGMERLIFDRLDRTSETDEFGTLLQLLHSAPELSLTHLKLWVPAGIWEEEAFELFTLLARAPLRVLVLNGLDTASPALLEHIATTLPGLIGLTLQLARRRVHTRPVHWPAPAEAYATALAGCTALEYFGWNNHLVVSASPAAMVHFEEGTCKDECAHDEAIDATFDEAEDLARLFAARCPALRSLAFHRTTSGFLAALCRIVRDSREPASFEVERAVGDLQWFSKRYITSPPHYNPGSCHAWPLLDGRPSDLNDINYSSL